MCRLGILEVAPLVLGGDPLTEKTCRLDYCTKSHYAKDLCGGHYQQQWRGEELRPLGRPSPQNRGCLVEGCVRPHSARGFCDLHSRQEGKGVSLLPLGAPSKRKPRVVDGKFHCWSCQEYLDEDRFSRNKSSKHGITSTCKSCYNIRSHGLTKEFYDKLSESQGGRCAICGTTPSKLVIDHDHACCPKEKSCGKCVRKLLCPTCNSGLGFYKDSPELLIKAAEYLKDHNAG